MGSAAVRQTGARGPAELKWSYGMERRMLRVFGSSLLQAAFPPNDAGLNPPYEREKTEEDRREETVNTLPAPPVASYGGA
jgi:hypothetical protein